MKRLVVVSPAFYDNPNSLLVDSCSRLGLELHLYGIGEPFTTLFDTKITQLIPEVEKLETEYILFSDFSDSFILSDEDEIMQKFLKFNTNLLVSADKQHEVLDARYPYFIFRDNYPSSTTPWRYCNSGGYIGKKSTILELLDKMSTLSWTSCQKFAPIYRQSDWDNDQFRLAFTYLNGFPLHIDVNCEIFQTMGCSKLSEFSWLYVNKNAKMINMITHSTPCVVHFNGQTPGIEEAFNLWKGVVYA